MSYSDVWTSSADSVQQGADLLWAPPGGRRSSSCLYSWAGPGSPSSALWSQNLVLSVLIQTFWPKVKVEMLTEQWKWSSAFQLGSFILTDWSNTLVTADVAQIHWSILPFSGTRLTETWSLLWTKVLVTLEGWSSGPWFQDPDQRHPDPPKSEVQQSAGASPPIPRRKRPGPTTTRTFSVLEQISLLQRWNHVRGPSVDLSGLRFCPRFCTCSWWCRPWWSRVDSWQWGRRRRRCSPCGRPTSEGDHSDQEQESGGTNGRHVRRFEHGDKETRRFEN